MLRRYRFYHVIAGACALAGIACHSHRSDLPPDNPAYQGQIVSYSFESGAPGVGELTLVRMAPTAGNARLGFARINGSTRFVLGKKAKVNLGQVGLPQLRWAYVRVWYQGDPTSVTPTEIWGNAGVIVVDSSGTKPIIKSSE